MHKELLDALMGMAGAEGSPDLDGLLGAMGGGGDQPRVGVSGNTGPTNYNFNVSFDPDVDDETHYKRLREASATILSCVGVGLDDLPFADVMARAMTGQIAEMRMAHEKGLEPNLEAERANPVLTSDSYHILRTDASAIHTGAVQHIIDKLEEIEREDRPREINVSLGDSGTTVVTFLHSDGNEETLDNGISELIMLARKPSEELGEPGDLVLIATDAPPEHLQGMGLLPTTPLTRR